MNPSGSTRRCERAPSRGNLIAVWEVKVHAPKWFWWIGLWVALVPTLHGGEVSSFCVSVGSSTQVAGAPFSVAVCARDPSGAVATDFAGNATLTVLSEQGGGVVPQLAGPFSAGVWTGLVTLSTAGPAATLIATESGGAEGVSSPIAVLLPEVHVMALAGNDAVYDGASQRIYVATPSSGVVPVDPLYGLIEDPIGVGTDAGPMAISSDGQFLYVGKAGGTRINRVHLPSRTPGIEFALGYDSPLAPWAAEDMVVPPERPTAVAVSRMRAMASPRHRGVAIYDDGIQQYPVTSVYSSGPNAIEPGPTPDLLYGLNNETSGFDLYRLGLTNAGIAVLGAQGGLLAGSNTDIRYEGGRIYATTGRVIDPERGSVVGVLPHSGLMAPDSSLGRVFVLADDLWPDCILFAYGTQTFQEIGHQQLPDISGDAKSLFRWGTDGLAFLTTGGKLYLVRSALVPRADEVDLAIEMVGSPSPGWMGGDVTFTSRIINWGPGRGSGVVVEQPVPAGASVVAADASRGSVTVQPDRILAQVGELGAGESARVSLRLRPAASGQLAGSATVSSSSAERRLANNACGAVVTVVSASPDPRVRRIPLAAGGLVYDVCRARLCASLSQGGGFGQGCLVPVEPGNASVGTPVAIGPGLGRMAISDDGGTIYVAANASYGVVMADGESLLPGVSFSAGTLPIADMAAVPGSTVSVAVATTGRIAMFDGVAKRSGDVTTPGGDSPIEFGDDADRLYGYDWMRGFLTMATTPTGLVLESNTAGLIQGYETDFDFGAGLVFASDGRVIDPAALVAVTNLAASGQVVVDGEIGRAFFLEGTNATRTIRAIDTETFAETASLTIGGVGGETHSFVRWGTNGLAFATGGGELVLVEDISLVPYPPLRLVVPEQIDEGSGAHPGAGLVTLPRPQREDVAVDITTDNSIVSVSPSRVVVRAGAMAAPFDITAHDDGGLNGTRSARLTATTAAHLRPGSASIRVRDDETTVMTLVVPPEMIEGVTNQGTVSIEGVAAGDIVIALSAGDSSRVLVPASVTISQGLSWASFDIIVPGNDLIEPDAATAIAIEASVDDWLEAASGLTVHDDEDRRLALLGPASAYEGDYPKSVTVRLAARAAAPIAVALSSGDESEVLAPSPITIAAGASEVSGKVTIVDDAETDGRQECLLHASGAGLVPAQLAMTVEDNDLYDLSWMTIPGTVFAGQPSTVVLRPSTVDGQPPRSAIRASVTAETESGPSPSLPVDTGDFYATSWTGTVRVAHAGSAVRLTAAATGVTETSAPFVVRTQPHSTFEWASLGTEQRIGEDFGAVIRGTDLYGNVITSFVGGASLEAWAEEEPEAGATGWRFASDEATRCDMRASRVQMIYRREEIGRPGKIIALALRFEQVPAMPMTSWTIRFKHTALSAYTSPTWESTGWQQVFFGTGDTFEPGWVYFWFNAPFDYDGIHNLMVTLHQHNASGPVGPAAKTTWYQVGERRTAYYSTPTYSGAPGAWTGTTPGIYGAYALPVMRFVVGTPIRMSPSATSAFSTGAWQGAVRVLDAAPAVRIVARAGSASGASERFAALAPLAIPELDPMPEFSAGPSNRVSWCAVSNATSYEVECSEDPAFGSAATAGLTTNLWHTFHTLDDGVEYHYRSRALLAAPDGSAVWLQNTAEAFAGDGLQNALVSTSPVGVALAPTNLDYFEAFDAPGTAWADQIFSDGTGVRAASILSAPDTVPPLPINAGGDLEADVRSFANMPNTSANRFSNGSIEGYLAPLIRTNASYFKAGFRLRGAYYLQLQRLSADSASLILQKSGQTLQPATASFPLSLGNECYRMQFSAQGSALRARLWRAAVTNGGVAEFPVALTNGSNEMTWHDPAVTNGVAGLYVNSDLGTNHMAFDDVRVTMDDPGVFHPEGSITGPVIAPAHLASWGTLYYEGDISKAGTSLLVDVLDENGAVLATGLASGANLSAIPAVADRDAIRLRARLITTVVANSPMLSLWAVSYRVVASPAAASGWSEVRASTPCHGPTIAIDHPADGDQTARSALRLSGRAAATSGIGSVTVNGVEAESTDGYAHWTARLSDIAPGQNLFLVEAWNRTDPSLSAMAELGLTRVPDADGDGLPDAWESGHGLDSQDNGSGDPMNGSSGDPDGDGVPNWAELAMGEDPSIPRRMPLRILGADADPATGTFGIVVSYSRPAGFADATYWFEGSDDCREWSPDRVTSTPLGVPVRSPDGSVETCRFRLWPGVGDGPRTGFFFRLNLRQAE